MARCGLEKNGHACPVVGDEQVEGSIRTGTGLGAEKYIVITAGYEPKLGQAAFGDV